MSVAHQKCVRVLLDKVIGLGLIPNLLPGVDPLNKTVFSSTLDALNDIQVIKVNVLHMSNELIYSIVRVEEVWSPAPTVLQPKRIIVCLLLPC